MEKYSGARLWALRTALAASILRPNESRVCIVSGCMRSPKRLGLCPQCFGKWIRDGADIMAKNEARRESEMLRQATFAALPHW